ncbi:MAG: hypothetical protein Q8M09_01565 [Pseudomonadota bacterium]|nr:hypothetical protein [Pseudomonadota bacterium]MDP1902932.1 hypothetical protein [Pseudomonadota bacterium]MDP2353031.1 hypothetical protein [Pseudomonadota bacterium]
MNLRLPAPLRLPAIWFVASLLLGSSVFYLALDARTSSETRQQAALRTAEQATLDLRRAPERLARLDEQASIYAMLNDAGFLGEEARLDWLGDLARLRASLDLQQLSWRLEPRTASSLSHSLYSSGMVLEISPTDSVRLGQFLDQLRTHGHGRFTVRECTLLPDANGKQGAATCALDWWTWDGQ